MPGKCKFQDSWLAKDIYKDWLVKDIQDIHFARCRACCKSIKLQAMGEAALTSHAGGAGHKAAVRKLLEGNLKLMDAAGQKNRTLNRAEDTKEQVAICLQRVALDRIAGRDWSDPHHSPNTKSTSHIAELHNVTLPAAYFTAPGTEVQDNGSFSAHTPRQEQQQGALSVEQQQHQMKVLEWKNRMKLLTWEHELVREKRRAVKQKEKAFRMKKAYYKAKLKRLGEDILASSSSSDEEEKTHDLP